MKSRGIPHQYACFVCRKSFKRAQFSAAYSHYMTAVQIEEQRKEIEHFENKRTYLCPNCGGPTHYMGTDFKAPKKTDLKGWAKVQVFIKSGKVFFRRAQNGETS